MPPIGPAITQTCLAPRSPPKLTYRRVHKPGRADLAHHDQRVGSCEGGECQPAIQPRPPLLQPLKAGRHAPLQRHRRPDGAFEAGGRGRACRWGRCLFVCRRRRRADALVACRAAAAAACVAAAAAPAQIACALLCRIRACSALANSQAVCCRVLDWQAGMLPLVAPPLPLPPQVHAGCWQRMDEEQRRQAHQVD